MKYLDQHVGLAILCSNRLPGWRPGAETCTSLTLVSCVLLGTFVGSCVKDE
jgi:hypothetical protein